MNLIKHFKLQLTMEIQELIKLIEERELLKPGQKGSYICVVDGCTKESKFSRGEGIRKSLCEAHKNQLPNELKQQFTHTSLLLCKICNTSRANYKNNTTGKYDRCKNCLNKESDPSNWDSGKSNTCHYQNCKQEARYGPYILNGIKTTRKDAIMCSSHKLSEYVNLSSRLCQGYGNKICTQSDGNPATAKFVHVDAFKQHMSNKKTTKLASRKKTPFPTHCLKCIPDSESDMYVNTSSLCQGDKSDECTFGTNQTPLQANWGILKNGVKTRSRCYKHKLDTDVSCSSMCIICNSMFASKEQMCCGCYNNSLITKLYNTYKNDVDTLYKKLGEMMNEKKLKTKEILVLQNLKIENGIFQYQVHNPFCDDENVSDKILLDDYKTKSKFKYAVIDMYGYYKKSKIIIEIDENQHKTYPCDFLRMVKIFKSFKDNAQFILIRINPDEFISNGEKMGGMFELDDTGRIHTTNCFENRMLLINKSINEIVENTTENKIIFINYDTNSKVVDDYKELAPVEKLYHM